MCKNNGTKNSLIKTGLNLFSKKGFHAVGINEIVKLSRIPKGSFYNYFSSKEEFVTEVLKVGIFFNNKRIDEINRNDDEVKFIINFLTNAIKSYEPDQAHSGLMFANNAGALSQTSNALRSSLSTYIEQSLETVRLLLTRAQSKDAIRTDLSVDQIASFFWDSWQGALLRAQIEQSAEPLHQVVEFIFGEFIYQSKR